MGAFEDFVNLELPKRISTNEDGEGSGSLPVGRYLRTTGVGLGTETVTTTTLSGDADHDLLTNTHNLTTDIDHNTITNNHNLTTDINHNLILNNHNLTTDIDHNQLTNFVSNEHINWTSASAGTIHASNYVDNDTTDHTAFSNIGTNTHSVIDTHLASTANPHSVDATDVSLGNVTNVSTSDVAYNSTSWNTNLDAATKNAIRDKVETMDTAIGSNTSHSSGSGSDHTDVATNTTHRGLTNNPHSVDASDVSLGNVTNVATDDTTYNATTWNTNTDSATKNSIRDKIETMDTAIGLNTAKTTNATHTGEVTGSTTLTLDKTSITGKSTVTADNADFVLLSDTSDTGNLKKALVSDFGGGGSSLWEVDGTETQLITADSIDMQAEEIIDLAKLEFDQDGWYFEPRTSSSFFDLGTSIGGITFAWSTTGNFHMLKAGGDIVMNQGIITGLIAPTDDAQAANKLYVDDADALKLDIADNLSDVNNQQTALDNVTNVSAATNEYVLTKDTASGNAIFKVAAGGSTPIFERTITIESPTSSEDITMFFTNRAITITEMRAVLVGSSTPSVTWTIRHSTDRSVTGNEVVTGGTTTTSTTSGSDVISFNDATIPADSFVWIETTAQSGTVTELNVTVIADID